MAFRALPVFFLLLLASLAWAGAARAEPAPVSIAALLQGDGVAVVAGRTVDRALLNGLYAGRDYRPFWDAAAASALRQALVEAPSHGLDPGAFALPDAGPAETDILLTDGFVRYAAALARGRVNMADSEEDWVMPQPAVDPAKLLRRAQADGVAATLAALPPPDDAYRRLRAAYARYQDYARAGAWRPIALALPIRPGDDNPGVATLRARLAAEDLAPDGDSAGTVYDDKLAEAVKKFQAARGLPADGAIGQATLAALNISPGERVREIRLNLERRRALPREAPPNRIEVNVPAAGVVLYDGGAPALAMRAVVGAIDHPTPVMKTRMVAVTFNPPWNVPASIIVNELRPALQKDPNFLKKNDYVYVDVNGGRQLIQKPGPKNPLGRIKFEMPNRLDIYLHDTPRRELMDRSRRNLSHGCIRVDNPRELARRVLAGDPAWSMDAINATADGGKTVRVPLPRAIPVYLFYQTAWVDADGTVEFRNDIYGRDRRLNQALVARDLAEQLPSPAPALSRNGD